MKTLFTTSNTGVHGIIPDEVYCQGNKEDGFTYHRRVTTVDWYADTYKDGYWTGDIKKTQLWADDIIRLADEIKRIRQLTASKDEMPEDLYGF